MSNQQAKKSWRIDSQIDTVSLWHRVFAVLWLSLLLLVMLVAQLAWWQWLIMLFVLGAVIYLYYQRDFEIVHLTQPTGNSVKDIYSSPWFVYACYDFDEEEFEDVECWQGYLTTSHVGRYLVVLAFDIVEPFQRSLSVPIWRDQVSNDDWRKLQTLSRLS
ncbi:MAG: hypothetical protein KGV51_01520 [Moraxellaceae bacterium]|nr:hypothetical protein [Moraxellaceae bacterium]